jgi:hypothetical protein
VKNMVKSLILDHSSSLKINLTSKIRPPVDQSV